MSVCLGSAAALAFLPCDALRPVEELVEEPRLELEQLRAPPLASLAPGATHTIVKGISDEGFPSKPRRVAILHIPKLTLACTVDIAWNAIPSVL